VVKKLAPNPRRDRGYTGTRLRTTEVGFQLLPVHKLIEELEGYWDVLLGRTDSPVTGMHALQEVADQYYARASEMTALIQRYEADGTIEKGSELVKFRTGELRTFREVAARAADLGSRRLTALSVESEQARLGKESAH
jgi:hypothetical protein